MSAPWKQAHDDARKEQRPGNQLHHRLAAEKRDERNNRDSIDVMSD
jgi:hypothetical protein